MVSGTSIVALRSRSVLRARIAALQSLVFPAKQVSPIADCQKKDVVALVSNPAQREAPRGAIRGCESLSSNTSSDADSPLAGKRSDTVFGNTMEDGPSVHAPADSLFDLGQRRGSDLVLAQSNALAAKERRRSAWVRTIARIDSGCIGETRGHDVRFTDCAMAIVLQVFVEDAQKCRVDERRRERSTDSMVRCEKCGGYRLIAGDVRQLGKTKNLLRADHGSLSLQGGVQQTPPV